MMTKTLIFYRLYPLTRPLPHGIPIAIDIFQDDHGRENREKPPALRDGKGGK